MKCTDEKLKSWKITYCGWVTPTELLDNRRPFKTAYIVADTATQAVSKLKKDLHLVKIDLQCQPELELVSREEYECAC